MGPDKVAKKVNFRHSPLQFFRIATPTISCAFEILVSCELFMIMRKEKSNNCLELSVLDFDFVGLY